MPPARPAPDGDALAAACKRDLARAAPEVRRLLACRARLRHVPASLRADVEEIRRRFTDVQALVDIVTVEWYYINGLVKLFHRKTMYTRLCEAQRELSELMGQYPAVMLQVPAPLIPATASAPGTGCEVCLSAHHHDCWSRLPALVVL